MSAGTDHVLVASMARSPRAVQRVVTAITGCGYAIDDLQYRRSGDCYALMVVALNDHMASRDLNHLCKIVDGTIGVLWSQSLRALSSRLSPLDGLRIDDYEITILRIDGHARMLARAAVMIDGRRHLGAGEGVDGTDALVRAVEAAVCLAGDGEVANFRVVCRWSNPSHDTPALVMVDVQHVNGTESALGVGADELEATARALEGLNHCSPQVDPVTHGDGPADLDNGGQWRA